MKPDPVLMLRRRLVNRFMTGMFLLAAAISVGALILILGKLLIAGGAKLSPTILIASTPAPGATGGLLNAILGSLAMNLVAIVTATPIAVLAGTYLAEYGRNSWLGHIVRFLNDTLLSAPSIIIGLFIYSVIVVHAGHFSGWAGAASLAVIALPVIVRTTEDMMRLIPDSLREAAIALGCPYWRMVVSVGWRAARPGIVTGILLALARISGETAPLLFTALNNQFLSTNMNGPMASLPVVIFQFAMSPYRDWQTLAWVGALLITVSVLFLNVVARTVISRGAR